MSDQIKIGIFGGSGYGGSELLRILLLHPNAELVFVTANEHAGKPVVEVHRNLAGLTDLKFSIASDISAGVDCAFFALPHGQAMDVIPKLPTGVKAIDLSGDFRLRDQEVFEKHYKQKHTAMQLQSEFLRNQFGIATEQFKKMTGGAVVGANDDDDDKEKPDLI